MKTEYRIQLYGTEFIVVAPCGEQLGVYPTEEAARQALERCKTESIYQTAKILVDNAIRAQMQLHEIDFTTARDSLLSRFFD